MSDLGRVHRIRMQRLPGGLMAAAADIQGVSALRGAAESADKGDKFVVSGQLRADGSTRVFLVKREYGSESPFALINNREDLEEVTYEGNRAVDWGLWNDENRDGKLQQSEVTSFENKTGQLGQGPNGAYRTVITSLRIEEAAADEFYLNEYLGIIGS